MRCFFTMESYDQAKAYAEQVIVDSQTPEDIKRTATYWRAKINFTNSAYSEAQSDLASIANFGGERGAECQYMLCTYPYRAGDFKQTETAIFQLIDEFAAFDTWKHKSFLLLIDAYIGMEDWFQAKTTAESILEFVEDAETRTGAENRLLQITTLEAMALETIDLPDSTSTEAEMPEAP
jgi:hypothetical protein